MKILKKEEIEKLRRYIRGPADPDEVAWIEGLFAHGQENPELKRHLELDWEEVLRHPSVEGANLNRILDRVHHLIRAKESQKRKTFVSRVANIYFKAAAILLLPLIIAGSLYFGYFSGSPTKFSGQNGKFSVYAPLGSRIAFNLPDGTKGWLNSGSTLTYPLPFDENRNVALEGEAWFDVFQDEKRPFEVKAGESAIRVLGTSFNVSAYRDEKYVEVVLQSGKVEFSDESQTEKVILQPSEQLILHENRLTISSVDVSKYKAWTEGRLVFRGDYMAEVAKKIERWYNIKVEIADQDLTQFSFRATFVDDALEDVLNQLSMTSPIEYKILPGKQLQDGTYEKEKVILYKK